MQSTELVIKVFHPTDSPIVGVKRKSQKLFWIFVLEASVSLHDFMPTHLTVSLFQSSQKLSSLNVCIESTEECGLNCKNLIVCWKN